MGLGGGEVKLHPMGKASMPGSSSPCPSEEGLSTREDLEEDESDSPWEENGPSLRWLRAETRTQKSVFSLGSIHPSGVVQIGFRGSGALIKKYLELGSCMWTFFCFFLERRDRVFITFFKASLTLPKLKAAPSESPWPFRSPQPRHSMHSKPLPCWIFQSPSEQGEDPVSPRAELPLSLAELGLGPQELPQAP